MKRVRNSARVFALVLALTMLLALGVSAAEDGSVWIMELETEDGTAAYVVTDSVVTDGVVAVNYDAEKLTYQSVDANDAAVAMYAVNADEAGVVLISWVSSAAAPEDSEWLFRVNFAGTSDKDTSLDGEMSGGEIKDAPVRNRTELKKADLEASGLNKGDYSEETWAALEEAMAAAEAVLADPTATQEEIDAAVEALRAAMEALELAEEPAGDVDKSELKKAVGIAEGLKKGNYTAASWKALEKALKAGKAVLADGNATQKEVDAAAAALKDAIAGLKLLNAADTGDDANLVVPIVAAVACVAAIVAMVAVKNKKNKGGKA